MSRWSWVWKVLIFSLISIFLAFHGQQFFTNVSQSFAENKIASVFSSSGTVDYVLTHEYSNKTKINHPEELLIQGIDQSKTSIQMSIFSITLTSIGNALKEAKKRGVDIRVIADGEQSQNKYQKSILLDLVHSGIPVKLDQHKGYMHLKLTVIDDQIVYVGSFNYSKSASSINDEILLKVSDESMAKQLHQEFDRMWIHPSFK